MAVYSRMAILPRIPMIHSVPGDGARRVFADQADTACAEVEALVSFLRETLEVRAASYEELLVGPTCLHMDDRVQFIDLQWGQGRRVGTGVGGESGGKPPAQAEVGDAPLTRPVESTVACGWMECGR